MAVKNSNLLEKAARGIKIFSKPFLFLCQPVLQINCIRFLKNTEIRFFLASLKNFGIFYFIPVLFL